MATKLLTIALLFTLVACATKEVAQEATIQSQTDQPERKLLLHPKGTDSGELEGFTSINFGFDKSSLTSSAKSKLRGNAQWLKENTELNLQIEGHCDTKGSSEYNKKLGNRRSDAVRNYLISIGVSPERLSVISYGEGKTLSTSSSDRENRRVNLLPIPR